MAGYLGIPIVPDTALDIVMESEDTLSVTVTGTVRRTEETDYGAQVILTDIEVLWEGEILETHDLLLQAEDGCSLNLAALLPGNQIQVTGTISSFSDAVNPGQFSYRDYYRVKGIDYVMEVKGGQVTDGRSFVLSVWAGKLRALLAEGITAAVGEGEEAALFQALILGDRGDLSDETRALYEVGGITHLLSISGLHLSLLGLGLWRLLRKLGIPMNAASLAAGLSLLAYVLFIGGSASAWRALIMFCAMLGARALGRTYDLLSALGLAGLLILWEQPLYAWQSGFQLSFAVMAGIGIVFPEVSGWCGANAPESSPGGLWAAARAVGEGKRALLFSVSVQITALPLIAWHYYTAPVYGVLVNLFAVPLMSTALVSVFAGTVAGIIWAPAGALAAAPARGIFRLFSLLCHAAEALPGSLVVLGRPAVWQMVLYYVLLGAGTLALSQRRRRLAGKETLREKAGRRFGDRFPRRKTERPKRKAGALPRHVPFCACLGIYLLSFLLLSPVPQAGLGITCLDVGQGDCTVLLLPDGTSCLVDGGSSNLSAAGEDRILPYLQYEGIRRVEMIFLTHPDEDHTNGIEEILTDLSVTVGGLAIPAATADDEGWEELLSLCAEEGVPVYYLQTGDVWRKGELILTCLHPEADYEAEDTNDASLVLLLEYRYFTGLLTGDIGTEEEDLLRDLLTDVDWLKVAHHGSRYSTGEEFLSLVLPEIATISCSATNTYGHPHADTMERLAEAGSAVFVTAEEGAIQLRVVANRVKIRLWVSGVRYFLPIS